MPRNATFKVQARGREFCRRVGIKTTISQGWGRDRELQGLGNGEGEVFGTAAWSLCPLEGWAQREAGCVSKEC